MFPSFAAGFALAMVRGAAMAQTALPLSISPAPREAPPAQVDVFAEPSKCNSRSMDGCQFGAELRSFNRTPVGNNASAPAAAVNPTVAVTPQGAGPDKAQPKTPAK